MGDRTIKSSGTSGPEHYTIGKYANKWTRWNVVAKFPLMSNRKFVYPQTVSIKIYEKKHINRIFLIFIKKKLYKTHFPGIIITIFNIYIYNSVQCLTYMRNKSKTTYFNLQSIYSFSVSNRMFALFYYYYYFFLLFFSTLLVTNFLRKISFPLCRNTVIVSNRFNWGEGGKKFYNIILYYACGTDKTIRTRWKRWIRAKTSVR